MASVGMRLRPLERPHEERPEEERRESAEHRAHVQQDGEADAGQGHVGQRIGRKRHAPHDREGAHHPGRDGHGDRSSRSLAAGTIMEVKLHRGPVGLSQPLGREDVDRRAEPGMPPRETEHDVGVVIDETEFVAR